MKKVLLCAALLGLSAFALSACTSNVFVDEYGHVGTASSYIDENGNHVVEYSYARTPGEVLSGEDYTDVKLRPANGYKPSEAELEMAREQISERLSGRIAQCTVTADKAESTLTVTLPKTVSVDQNYDYMQMVKEVSRSGKVTFRAGASYQTEATDPDGVTVYQTPVGESEAVLMDGSAIATAEFNSLANESGGMDFVVHLKLTDEGAGQLKKITAEYLNQTISIWLDDKMISSPTVSDVISDGELIISGDFTVSEARNLANQIRAGELPFTLEIVK